MYSDRVKAAVPHNTGSCLFVIGINVHQSLKLYSLVLLLKPIFGQTSTLHVSQYLIQVTAGIPGARTDSDYIIVL